MAHGVPLIYLYAEDSLAKKGRTNSNSSPKIKQFNIEQFDDIAKLIATGSYGLPPEDMFTAEGIAINRDALMAGTAAYTAKAEELLAAATLAVATLAAADPANKAAQADVEKYTLLAAHAKKYEEAVKSLSVGLINLNFGKADLGEGVAVYHGGRSGSSTAAAPGAVYLGAAPPLRVLSERAYNAVTAATKASRAEQKLALGGGGATASGGAGGGAAAAPAASATGSSQLVPFRPAVSAAGSGSKFTVAPPSFAAAPTVGTKRGRGGSRYKKNKATRRRSRRQRKNKRQSRRK